MPPMLLRTARASFLLCLPGLAGCGGGKALPEDPADRAQLAARGAELFRVHACVLCHAESADRTIGPSLAGIADREARLAGGATIGRDDAYLYDAIVEPAKHVLVGYANTMPPNPSLEREDVLALVAHVRGL
jgi:cytochrome c551/c552